MNLHHTHTRKLWYTAIAREEQWIGRQRLFRSCLRGWGKREKKKRERWWLIHAVLSQHAWVPGSGTDITWYNTISPYLKRPKHLGLSQGCPSLETSTSYPVRGTISGNKAGCWDNVVSHVTASCCSLPLQQSTSLESPKRIEDAYLMAHAEHDNTN